MDTNILSKVFRNMKRSYTSLPVGFVPGMPGVVVLIRMVLMGSYRCGLVEVGVSLMEEVCHWWF